MLKAMCIELPCNMVCPKSGKKPIVKVLNTYTVIDQGITLEKPWYELAEQPGFIYGQQLFIPISNLDEKQLLAKRLQQAIADYFNLSINNN